MAEERKRQRENRAGRNGKRRSAGRLSIPGLQGAYGPLALVFLALLVLLCVGNLLHRDRAYSEQENRVLAQRPSLTLSGVTSGRFMEQFEAYQSDQMIGRNLWVGVKTELDTLAGKKEENGVFLGRDSYLLEDIAVPEEENLQKKLQAMRQFAEAYPDVPMHMILVPNAANVLADKLPRLAVTADQSRLIRNVSGELEGAVQWIDAESILKESREESVYYRTDHHWTTLGAYKVFQGAREQLGLGELDTIRMKAYGVSNDFNGTLSAVSGCRTGYKEAIYVYLPEGEAVPGIVVNYVEEQKRSASLYDSEKLKERDQYAVFLGGNHALVDIKSTREDGERLLVIKDSYANCFLPFLAPYYREVVVVDPRYYTGDLGQLMQEDRIDRVLYLYNANTFFEDRMLSGVLESGIPEKLRGSVSGAAAGEDHDE